MKNVLVTGGCGFIGSNFVKYLISLKCYFPIILDKLTYAGSKENINQIASFSVDQVDELDEINSELDLNTEDTADTATGGAMISGPGIVGGGVSSGGASSGGGGY